MTRIGPASSSRTSSTGSSGVASRRSSTSPTPRASTRPSRPSAARRGSSRSSRLARAIRAHASASRANVGPEVAAIGLVSLIENAASSWLTQDAVFLGLGRRRFVTEAAVLAQRMVGGATRRLRQSNGRRPARPIDSRPWLRRVGVVSEVRAGGGEVSAPPRRTLRAPAATPPTSRGAPRRGWRRAAIACAGRRPDQLRRPGHVGITRQRVGDHLHPARAGSAASERA